jgi:hypothetical protein
MNKVLFFILRVLKNIQGFLWKIRGKTAEDIHAERIVSGKSWDEYCDQLKAAGASLMYPGSPRDPFQQAEGMRYLSRLTRAGLEAFVEFNDPAFPVFRRMVHETVKMGADNPDNYYFNAGISGNYEYRIHGSRNTVHYLGFFTQNGNYATTGKMEPCAQLEHTEMYVEDDGTFEIILSKTSKGRNWLRIEDATSLIIVRQTFADRTEEIPATLFIENLDGRKAPDPVTPAMIDEGLKTASFFVAGASLFFSRWAKDFQKHTNRLPVFDARVSNAAGGDPHIIYYHSHWKLNPDEALLIEVKPPACEMWNFQLNNYWMESLDYRYFTVCINQSTVNYLPDGRISIVVSHYDPGIPNWLNTCGHEEGTMCWRWYRLKPGEMPVEPECKVIHVKN